MGQDPAGLDAMQKQNRAFLPQQVYVKMATVLTKMMHL